MMGEDPKSGLGIAVSEASGTLAVGSEVIPTSPRTALRVFRVVSAEDLAAGRLDSGPLIVADSEEAARETYAVPGAPIEISTTDVLVEILTKEEIRRRRLETHYARRWRALEEEEERRRGEARRKFVEELTGERTSG